MVTAIGGVGAIWANGFQPSSEIRPSGGTDMTSAISGFGNVMSSQEMTQGTNPLFQALASTLGLSASQIQQQVSSGSSLAQIASNQGVSQSTLLSAVEGVLSQGPAQGLSSSQLTDMANTIVNQQGLPSGPPSSGLGGTSTNQGNSSSSSSVSTEFILLMLGATAQGAGGSASADAAYSSGSVSPTSENQYLA